MHKTPEEYQREWAKMNEEFIEEKLPFLIKIPTIEKIQDWIERKPDA